MIEMTPLSPRAVLEQVAVALPEQVRDHVIVIGSLAAGYYFFAGDGSRAVRTKDVDCLFTPHAKALSVARETTERLLDAQWTQQIDPRWGAPGNETQATADLPMVRLRPPGGAASWSLELLSAPPPHATSPPGKNLERVRTKAGDFAICSFEFLALAESEPISTPERLRIARPEMMALANMLHHPTLADTLIAGTRDKRCNKDLGRVLALAFLCTRRERIEGLEDQLALWPGRMWSALQEKFGARAPGLAARAGQGMEALLDSEEDLAQALAIANRGLLSSLDVGTRAYVATGRRLREEVLRPLAELAATRRAAAD